MPSIKKLTISQAIRPCLHRKAIKERLSSLKFGKNLVNNLQRHGYWQTSAQGIGKKLRLLN